MNKIWIIRTLAAGTCLSFQLSAADFKIEDRTLTVPDGFEIELIAAPPLVDRPISADFDDNGRLYVTDSSGSNDAPEKQLQEKPHRIVRLEDSKGDGIFDKSVVFADRMMFPEGAMWFEGSLYVGAPPSIWKLTDTLGNGVADRREEWMQGKTVTGCANDLHGPYAGPDGWIYWCKGAFAQQTYDRPGKEPFVTRAAHIFRCRPDASGFEPVMTGGMDNPVGVAFTPTGERILCATFLQDPGGGKRDGLIHAIYGGVYGKVHDVIDEHPRTGDILPVLSHLGPAAPCSVISYSSDTFGPEYRDNLFTCCFNLHKVLRHQLTPDGATYKTTPADFLSSTDPDFHPTCVLEDADGSLIILDTGGWYKLCCPTSQLAKPDVLGHIYRVRRVGAPKIEDPRGNSILWASQSPDDLVKFLADPRPFVRKRAIRSLGRLGDKSVASLAASLKSFAAPEQRRNALWALTRINSPSARQAVRGALMDSDDTVRHIAALSIGLWRDAEAITPLLALLADEDAQVQRSAAEAIGRIGNPAAVPFLLDAVGRIDANTVQLPAGARILEHSIIFAMIEIGDRAAIAEGLSSQNPRVHRAALIATDQMRNGQLESAAVTPLLVSTSPVLKDTANWIISRHSDWGGALAGFFQERFKASDMSASEAANLVSQLAPFATDHAIAELLANVLADGASTKPARIAALKVMAKAGPAELPQAWLQQVTEMLQSQDTDLLSEAIATARAFSKGKPGGPALDSALDQIGADADRAPELRLEALAAAGPHEALSTNLFDLLLSSLDASKPWTVRNNAASILTKSKLDRAQLLILSDALHGVGASELAKLIVPFGNSPDEVTGVSLVENLKHAKAVSSLRIEVIKPILEKFPATVQTNAAALFAMLGADAAKQEQHVDQLLAELPEGDIRRGQAIFNNPKFACVSCHAIGYIGGHLGPDLTSVGTVRTRRDILESVVYPSASFVRSFEPMIVSTKSGDDYTGILRKDAADEVILATGPESEIHLARSDIVEMRQGTVSIMPQGLDAAFTRQELADLLAFLKDTKWGAR